MTDLPFLDKGFSPLTKAQKALLFAGLLLVVLFGGIVELRGAFQATRKTDAGVFFRAGWAVRSGADIYLVADNNDWHYVYPPLFAILMAPLADPPPGADRFGTFPYAVSLGLWYALNCGLLAMGSHVLATALERSSPSSATRSQPPFCQRWWALRLWPTLVCLPAVGENLLRGQVGLILFVLFAFMAKALLEGKAFRAGIWLSGAIALKVIPAFLLLMPFVRRSRPMILGCVTGLAVGLVLVPSAVLGPSHTASGIRSFVGLVLVPGVLSDHQGLRGGELTGIRSTSNCSPLAVIHALRNPDPAARPDEVGTATRAGHVAIVLGLTAATLYFFLRGGGSRRRLFCHASEIPRTTLPSETAQSSLPSGPSGVEMSPERRDVLLLAALSTVMNIASPVYHPHYFSQSVFPVMVLLAGYFEQHPYPTLSRSAWGLFGVLVLGYVIWLATERMPVRDFGPVLFSSLVLWAACVRETVRRGQ